MLLDKKRVDFQAIRPTILYHHRGKRFHFLVKLTLDSCLKAEGQNLGPLVGDT